MESQLVETIVEDQCYVIRQALTPSDQAQVFEDLMERSKNTDNTSTSLYPSPKTIRFDGELSSLKFNHTDKSSVYKKLILEKAADHLFRDGDKGKHAAGPTWLQSPVEFTVAAIRYDVATGALADHVDHCNDGSWVVLLSLGCTAKFNVNNKGILFRSGDVLVFDPSTKARLSHGIESIVPQEEDVYKMDDGLIQRHPTLKLYRFGVQCRVKPASIS